MSSRWYAYVYCISIGFIALTMVVYIAYPKLMESSYSKLMMNYMITTMMAYITIVLAQTNFGASISFSEKHPNACKVNGK